MAEKRASDKKHQLSLTNQHGQTMVEFILLFAVLSTLSITYLRVVNGNLADHWEHIVNTIILDKAVSKDQYQVRIP